MLRAVSPLCLPTLNLKKKNKFGSKIRNQAKSSGSRNSKFHNLWMWLETGKSVLKEPRQINWKQNHDLGGLHFSVATYATVAVLSSGCYMVVKGSLKEFKINVL